jgi:hypothetical protein
MKYLCYILLTATVLISVASCSDEESTSPSGLLYSYIPVNVGHELIYDVSLITKDEFSQQSDTFYYQVKEVIESVFLDNQGRPTQRLERYRRDSVQDPWVIADVWTSNLSSTKYEKNEDNVPYVKLVFPVSYGGTWNGNVLNTYEPAEYEYISLNDPATIGATYFDSTLTVLQADLQTFIDTVYSEERYAAGVGMVYRFNKEILVDYSNPGQPGIKAQRLYKEIINSWNN